MIGRTPIDSRWCRVGVRALRLHGPRGRVRYRIQFADGSVSSAGFFPGYLEAIRHAHQVAKKRSRIDSMRAPKVGSGRWLWSAGDLEELAAGVRRGEVA